MKLEELRGKSADQLKATLLDLRKESLNLRFQKATATLEKTHRVSEVRRDIARVKTLLTEERLGLSPKAKQDKPAAKKAAKVVKSKKTKGE